MLTVTLYKKDQCAQCDEAREILKQLEPLIPHRVVEINVEMDSSLKERIGNRVPVIQTGPYILKWPFTQQEVRVSLSAARDRRTHLEESGDKQFARRIRRGHSISRTDRFSYWLSLNYMWIISFLLLLYVGLPVLAPVIMHFNLPGPANVIYSMYKPLCHQLGFRSVFLFGEQAFYPRELAGIEGLKTYEEVTSQVEIDVLAARNFIGNEAMGYKIAFCQRDLAIYGAMFIFSLVFIISKRRIKSIPWYVWIILGLIPIGFDGVSQLPSVAAEILPSWLPIRESVPALRFLTGGLFGLTTAWYLFPMIEETMQETARVLARKFSIVEQLDESNKIVETNGTSHR